MSNILSLPEGRDYSQEDVRRVVANSDKQRFALKEEAGQLWIRANQGHSMEVYRPHGQGRHCPRAALTAT